MRTYVLAMTLIALVYSPSGAQLDVNVPAPSVRLNDPLKAGVHASQTTLEDRTDLGVTVYNNNLALVRDQRRLTLLPGEHRLAFMDVAQQIRPETVSLKSISDPGTLQVLEQNYEYDLMNPEKMMEKFVGRRVQLVNFSTEIGFTTRDAILLSVHGGPIYEIDGKIFLGHPGVVVLPEIPENLIAKPSLIWLVDNRAGDQEVEVTYLTQGMRWQADYVLTLDQDERSMAVAGWVPLANESGAAYTDAKLKLVAGDVHVAPPPMQPMPKMMRAEAMDMAYGVAQEAFAEYHLYTLPRRTTIKENQSKQVSLLTAEGVAVEKEYEVKGNPSIYFQILPPQRDQSVDVYLKFQNKEQNNLGMPLPAGVMRVYQADSEGMLQFTGEDRIKHTPRNEEVRLKTGAAFDIVVDRVQMDFAQIARNVFESAYEITLRNHKDNDITVNVVEPMQSDWEIVQTSHEFTQKDAFTAVFAIPVPANGETVLTYRVRVQTR
jgi:hypothetical protein